MALKRLTASFLAALLICPPALAQTPTQPQTQKEDKSQKEDKELEKKALALLDEVVGEAMSLKLVENRIFALTTAADLYWKRNEDRARALLAEAVNQFMAIERPSQSQTQPQAEPDGLQALQAMGIRMELRTQLLQTLAARDSRMALDFLRASRLPDAGKLFGGKVASPDFERDFEMQLAARIAENDPRTALQIAEESLKQGVTHQVYEIWANLLNKDPKAAAKLSGDITSAIKSADALKDYQSIYVVTSMLTQLRTQMRPSRSNATNAKETPPPQEAQDMFRDLLDLMISTALKVTTAQLLDFQEQGRARDLLTQVQMFLPDIEKQLPSRAQAVRAKLAQFDKAFVRQQTPQEVFEDMENKSPDELIAMAAKSQDEFKDLLYRQAATKLIEQGDTARARQIVKDFLPDEGSWDPLFAEIDRKEREQAMKEGKLEEARKSVSRLGSSEERALALIELAMKAEAEKDQKSQRELLKEAGELLGDQMETRSQVEAQLVLAAASLNLDPDRGFEILGSGIDRLNTVLNAVATITKFDQGGTTPLASVNAGNALDGEMRLNAGEFSNVTTNLDQQLLAFARKDFDRTVTMLKRWQVNEVRLAICLTLLNRILGAEKVEYRGSRIEYGRSRIDD
ncbi:MAG TPA: hypothetical protein VFV58_36345 [Blastocatellia bacterium]|jgi:hypothetical protein|nr:hypothetical protein [Blastocatellia bacterium]